jgi:benzoyl-CoA reductase/2-hydroxyglutaryl-CoA dehydratase subunit BcrC/BadD/HgdB
MKMKKVDLMKLRAEILQINAKERGMGTEGVSIENSYIGLVQVLYAIKNCTTKKEMCGVQEFEEVQLAEKNSVYDIYKNWDYNCQSLDEQPETIKKTLFILLVKYKK